MTETESHWAETSRELRKGNFPAREDWIPQGEIATDGSTWTGWEINCELPAYLVGDELVSFTPAFSRNDPCSDEFSAKALKDKWRTVSQDDERREAVKQSAEPLLSTSRFKVTGTNFPETPGEWRRPRFFGDDPWNEEIAELDNQTTVFEVAAPRDAHEILILKKTNPITLRGWHIAGEGVPGPDGERQRVVLVLIGGRSVETFAVHDVNDPPAEWDAENSEWGDIPYPVDGKRTEFWGGRTWRGYMTAMVRAGFDIVTFDKRGHGLSGGDCSNNCNEQANDIFCVLSALRGKGEGVFDGPQGDVSPPMATDELINCPIFIGGASQGSMVTTWAMHKAFVGNCDYDGRPEPSPPVEGFDIRGGLLLAPASGGMGGRFEDFALMEAYMREEEHLQFMAGSEVARGMGKWPAVFIGKGLWDYLEGLETSLETIRRHDGHGEIHLVRGGHSESSWGRENMNNMQAAMIGFMKRALAGNPAKRSFNTLKSAVESTPPDWPGYRHKEIT